MKQTGAHEASSKTKTEIVAEREAKKKAKQLKRAAQKDGPAAGEAPSAPEPTESPAQTLTPQPEKTKEEILAERAAKKQEKKKGKSKEKGENAPVSSEPTNPTKAVKTPEVSEAEKETPVQPEKSKAQLRVERRMKQEEQRAKKAEATVLKTAKIENKPEKASSPVLKDVPKPKKSLAVDKSQRVKLFAHLYAKAEICSSVLSGLEEVHPSVARLGAQYRSRVVCGSNVRCLALLAAIKRVINDYRTPANEELSRGIGTELTKSMNFLQRCRPVSVSMSNAVKHLRAQITRCKGSEAEVKEELIDCVETYYKDQLDKAAEAISISVRQKIADGDVILTYSCSSLIQKILIAAAREGIRFRVIVVDGRPWLEGRELLRRLLLANIPCTYILVNAVSFVMPEVTKILLGAHALLANGYVMSRCGSSQIALLGRTANVPVLVCCETHKFSERVQTDSFVHNELGNPDELLNDVEIAKWRSLPTLSPLNLVYDVTPPDLVSAVVTELAILPCTSVPVILRFK